jgi:predicted transposase/invertase (TIGR01784 family)
VITLDYAKDNPHDKRHKELLSNKKLNYSAFGNYVLNFEYMLVNAKGYNKSDDIQRLLSESQFREVDGMLCDMIEYAQTEKEEIATKARLEIAKNLLKMNIPLEKIVEATGFTIKELEDLQIA